MSVALLAAKRFIHNPSHPIATQQAFSQAVREGQLGVAKTLLATGVIEQEDMGEVSERRDGGT